MFKFLANQKGHSLDKTTENNAQFFYNTLSTLLTAGFGFLTMPIFTRLLGAEQYGLYSVYSSWVQIFLSIMGLGCGQGIATGMYRFKSDYYAFKTSIMVGASIISMVLLLVILVFARPISIVISYPIWLIVVLFLEAFSQYIINFSTGAWIYEKKAGINLIVSVSLLFFRLVFSLIFLLNWPPKCELFYLGRVFGTVVVDSLWALLIWISIFKYRPIGYNKAYWSYSISFGMPLIFHTLSQKVLTQSDIIMMQKFGTNNLQTGIYSFFVSFSGIITIVLNALNTSWCPLLYEELDGKKYKDLNKKIANYTKMFTILLCVFILVSPEFVKLFASEEYWEGIKVLPILTGAVYATFIYQFAVNYEFFKSKTKWVAVGTTGAAVFNIVLNMVLIPNYGMYGAALATLLSYMLLALAHILIVTYWNMEKYPFSWECLLIGGTVTCTTVFLYYILLDIWYIRWMLSIIAGFFLISSIIKRKSIF